MIYVADTHSLIWFLAEDSNLSKKAKEIFDHAEIGENTIVLPTIVLAELLYICEKKRASDKFSEIIRKIRNSTNYVAYNLDLDIILECKSLGKIIELHDRVIVATAKLLSAPIITKDKKIKESMYVNTVW